MGFQIVEGQVIITDNEGNPITSTVDDTKQLLDSLSVIRDATNPSYKAKVDNLGNQYFLTPAPATPADKNPIGHTFFDTVATQDIFTDIPNTKTITIQRFKCGAEADKNGGTVVTLWYAPNGNTTGIEIIEALFVNGQGDHSDLVYQSPAGNGTNKILMRLEHLSGGSAKMFAKWEGYY